MMQQFVFSVDLGQVKDPTAIACIEADPECRVMYGKERRQVYDLRGLQRTGAGFGKEVLVGFGTDSDEFFDRVVKLITNRLMSYPFYRNSILVIDATGIGRLVARQVCGGILAKANVPIYPMQIRAFDSKAKQNAENGLIQVSRHDLLSLTSRVLEQRRFRIPPDLALAGELKKELLAVRKDPRPPKSADPSAWRLTEHDDLALSVAQGLWIAERLQQGGVGGVTPVKYA